MTAEPLTLIARFAGDPDDLLERFETARRLWIEAQSDDYHRPIFYAACRADDGIAVISVWRSDADHQAFGRQMGPYLQDAGLGRPDQHEHLHVEQLGWE